MKEFVPGSDPMASGPTRVTASAETLVRQASITADCYVTNAIKTFEDAELPYTTADVIALAKVAAMDFHASALLVASQNIADAMEAASQSIVNAIADMPPLSNP